MKQYLYPSRRKEGCKSRLAGGHSMCAGVIFDPGVIVKQQNTGNIGMIERT